MKLAWFPVGGWGNTVPEHIRSLLYFRLSQGALGTSALVLRNIRGNVIEVLKMDYVDFAKRTLKPDPEQLYYPECTGLNGYIVSDEDDLYAGRQYCH